MKEPNISRCRSNPFDLSCQTTKEQASKLEKNSYRELCHVPDTGLTNLLLPVKTLYKIHAMLLLQNFLPYYIFNNLLALQFIIVQLYCVKK
jgi:hypothetical protein